MANQLEEVELELELAKEEKALAMETEHTSGSSGHVFQLESQIDTLKEALVKLKVASSEKENTLKSRISELEKNADAMAQNSILKEKLSQAQITIQDQREQLDMFLGKKSVVDVHTIRLAEFN